MPQIEKEGRIEEKGIGRGGCGGATGICGTGILWERDGDGKGCVVGTAAKVADKPKEEENVEEEKEEEEEEEDEELAEAEAEEEEGKEEKVDRPHEMN